MGKINLLFGIMNRMATTLPSSTSIVTKISKGQKIGKSSKISIPIRKRKILNNPLQINKAKTVPPQSTVNESFDTIKQNICDKNETKKLLDKYQIDKIKYSYNEKELGYILDELQMSSLNKYNKILEQNKTFKTLELFFNPKTMKPVKSHNRKISIEHQRFITDIQAKSTSHIIELLKPTIQKDSLPEVIAIKNILKTKHGIKKVYLDNNLEFANKILQAAEILKKNNLKFSDQIVVSKYLLANGLNTKINGLDTICLNSIKQAQNTATKHPLHVIVHEALHSQQPNLFLWKTQDIPLKFKETIKNLSQYAYGNTASEIHCELYTKKILEKLSPDEEKLFQYLGGTW